MSAMKEPFQILSEQTCWIILCFPSSFPRNTCLSVLPASNVCPSIPTGLKHMEEAHMGVQSDHWGRPERVCMHVCVCLCVCVEREKCLSVLRVSQWEIKMLTKLCCEKWFISTTVNLKACYISSSNLPNFIQTSTVPSAETQSKPCSFICPLCVFVARPFQTL